MLYDNKQSLGLSSPDDDQDGRHVVAFQVADFAGLHQAAEDPVRVLLHAQLLVLLLDVVSLRSPMPYYLVDGHRVQHSVRAQQDELVALHLDVEHPELRQTAQVGLGLPLHLVGVIFEFLVLELPHAPGQAALAHQLVELDEPPCTLDPHPLIPSSRSVLDVHLEQGFLPEQEALAVAHMERIDSFLDDQHHQGRCSAGLRYIRVLLVKLVIQLVECLVHQHSHHFIEVPRLVQEGRPFSDLPDQVVLHELHALHSPVPIQNSEQADQFPLTPSNVFLDEDPVFLNRTVADVQGRPAVEPGHLEGQTADLYLAMEGQREIFFLGNFGEHPLHRHQSALRDLGDVVLVGEDELGVASHVESLPAYFQGQVLQWLVGEDHVQPPVGLALLVPFGAFPAHFSQLFLFLLVKRVALEVVLLVGLPQFFQAVEAVEFQHLAQVVDVVDDADLFDFVHFLRLLEGDFMIAEGKLVPVVDGHAFGRDVHPCSTFAPEVSNHETLEPVVFELGVFFGQGDSFDLEGESIELGVAFAEDLSVGVGGDEDEAVLVESINALEDVLEVELADFSDVVLPVDDVVIVLGDGIDFVLLAGRPLLLGVLARSLLRLECFLAGVHGDRFGVGFVRLGCCLFHQYNIQQIFKFITPKLIYDRAPEFPPRHLRPRPFFPQSSLPSLTSAISSISWIYLYNNQMQPQILPEEVVQKTKSSLKDPYQLLILLPTFIDYGSQKKETLKNFFRVNEKDFDEEGAVSKEHAKHLKNVTIDNLLQVYIDINLYRVFCEDWSLQLTFFPRLYYSISTRLLFVYYKKNKEQQFQGGEEEEKLSCLLADLLGILNQKGCEHHFLSRVGVIKTKYKNKLQYVNMLHEISDEYTKEFKKNYQLSSVFKAKALIRTLLRLHDQKKPADLNNTYVFKEALESLGFVEDKDEENILTFHPRLRTKHRFRYSHFKKEDEITRKIRFECILSQKKKEEVKTNKNIEEIKIIRESHSSVYGPIIQKYFQKLDQYEIKFFENEDRKEELKELILCFFVDVSIVDEEEKTYFINTPKGFRKFLKKLQRVIALDFCFEQIMNEYKILEENAEDIEDEMSLADRRVSVLELDRLGELLELEEQMRFL